MEMITFCWLGMMSFEDVRKQQVSVSVLLVGGILLCARPIERMLSAGGSLYAIFAAVLPGLFLMVLAFATGRIGMADGMAVLFLGLMTGSDRVVLILCISLFVMSAVSIVLLLSKKANRQTRLPFFPFLALGWAAETILGGLPS